MPISKIEISGSKIELNPDQIWIKELDLFLMSDA